MMHIILNGMRQLEALAARLASFGVAFGYPRGRAHALVPVRSRPGIRPRR